VFFCYPNLHKKRAEAFFEYAERKTTEESWHEAPWRMHTFLVLAKTFQLLRGSYLHTFKARYRDPVPYHFGTIVDNGRGPQSMSKDASFILWNLKIKEERELTRLDIEYDFLRLH